MLEARAFATIISTSTSNVADDASVESVAKERRARVDFILLAWGGAVVVRWTDGVVGGADRKQSFVVMRVR